MSSATMTTSAAATTSRHHSPVEEALLSRMMDQGDLPEPFKFLQSWYLLLDGIKEADIESQHTVSLWSILLAYGIRRQRR